MDNISYTTWLGITEIDEVPYFIAKGYKKDGSDHYTLIQLKQFCGELMDGMLNCHEHVREIIQSKN